MDAMLMLKAYDSICNVLWDQITQIIPLHVRMKILNNTDTNVNGLSHYVENAVTELVIKV